MERQEIPFFDIETVPDELPKELLPTLKMPKYDSMKEEARKKKQAEKQKEFDDDLNKKLSVDPWTAKIVCLSIIHPNNNFTTVTNNEEDILNTFWYTARKYPTFGGFNILQFDMPLIYIRSAIHGIKPTKIYRVSPYKTVLIDVMYKLSNGFPAKAKSLDWYAKRFGIREKIGHGSEVIKWVKENNWKKIGAYCENDVIITKLLYEKTWRYYI